MITFSFTYCDHGNRFFRLLWNLLSILSLNMIIIALTFGLCDHGYSNLSLNMIMLKLFVDQCDQIHDFKDR